MPHPFASPDAPLRRAARALFLIGLGAVLAGGCTEPVRKQIRAWTYPPGFNYASGTQVRSAMHTIALELTRLDALLDETLPAEPDPPAVVGALQRIDDAIGNLGSDGWPSNHPRMAANAEQFRQDLSVALLGLQEHPPAYHPARTLSRSCRLCHERG